MIPVTWLHTPTRSIRAPNEGSIDDRSRDELV